MHFASLIPRVRFFMSRLPNLLVPAGLYDDKKVVEGLLDLHIHIRSLLLALLLESSGCRLNGVFTAVCAVFYIP